MERKKDDAKEVILLNETGTSFMQLYCCYQRTTLHRFSLIIDLNLGEPESLESLRKFHYLITECEISFFTEASLSQFPNPSEPDLLPTNTL